jgi:hypothetical protein
VTRSILLPDLSDDENLEMNAALAVISEKSGFNRLMQRRYDAEHSFRANFDSVIPPKYNRLGLILGWSAKAVDPLAARCALDTFVWPGGSLDDLGFTQLWVDNDLDSESFQAATSTLIHGTSFVAAAQPDDDTTTVHFYGPDVASGIWNPVTRQLDNLVVIAERNTNGEPTALTVYLDGRTVTASNAGGRWETVELAEHKYGLPAARLPYRPRLGRPFGRTRISRPVRALQDAAVRELVRLEGHMDIYSFPEFWMLGADESIFKNDRGEQQAKWQVMLGRIKGIPDDENATNPRADVKKFDASAPDPHLAAVNAYGKLLARELGLPDSALAITDLSNPTSADSYDASQYELIAEAERTARGWTAAMRKVMQAALAMKNGEPSIPSSFATIEPRWRDPRYLSRAQQADAGSKQLAAVPWLADTEVGLELIGLDPQQMKRALAEKQRAQSQQTLQTLAALAAARTSQQPAAAAE